MAGNKLMFLSRVYRIGLDVTILSYSSVIRPTVQKSWAFTKTRLSSSPSLRKYAEDARVCQLEAACLRIDQRVGAKLSEVRHRMLVDESCYLKLELDKNGKRLKDLESERRSKKGGGDCCVEVSGKGGDKGDHVDRMQACGAAPSDLGESPEARMKREDLTATLDKIKTSN